MLVHSKNIYILMISFTSTSTFDEKIFFRFMEDMSCMGLLPVLRAKGLVENAFKKQEMALTAEIMQNLFTVDFSEQGSNRHSLEQLTLSYFLDVLIDMEGG